MQIAPGKNGVTREELIDLLRGKLLELVDENTPVCKIAADRGIFCKGFLRFREGEFRRKFDWIDRKMGHPDRNTLEDAVAGWHLARQEVTGLPLACDVQQSEQAGCRGWSDFSDAELSRFYFELAGNRLTVN